MDVQTRDELKQIADEVQAVSAGILGGYQEGFDSDTASGLRWVLLRNITKLRELAGENGSEAA